MKVAPRDRARPANKTHCFCSRNIIMASLFKKSVAAVMGLRAVWKSKFYGAFVLNRRVVLHAIDALIDFHIGLGHVQKSGSVLLDG